MLESRTTQVQTQQLLQTPKDSGSTKTFTKPMEQKTQSREELDAAFVIAVQDGDLRKIQELIQAGADIHTPIPYTITKGDCDWDTTNTALIYAVSHEHPEMVKIFAKVEKNLDEALDLAIRSGYPEVVEELIKGGANLHSANKDGDTPLMVAIQNARAASQFSLQAYERTKARWVQRKNIIKILLNSGSDVTHVNKRGRTALMEAIREHDYGTVNDLLQMPEMTSGSYLGFGTKPINYADTEGNTALILALKYVRTSYINNQEYNICVNSQNIVKILLETPGIDPHHVNKSGESAITLFEGIEKKMDPYRY